MSEQRSVGRARRAASAAVAVALLLLPTARGEARGTARQADHAYREALGSLAAGSVEAAIGTLFALEEDRSESCVQEIELHLAGQFAELEPEAIVVQAFLRLAVQQAHYLTRSASSQPHGFERTSSGGLRRLGGLYVTASRHREAPSLVAGLLTYAAREVSRPRSRQRLEAARDLLRAARALDPDHLAALHSLAVTNELLSRPGQALESLDRLIVLAPDDTRFRLRRAVVMVRSGQQDRGRRLLDELRWKGPPWVRDLATQEVARLLLETGRGDEAEALLRQGLAELPREKLSLQLAALLDPRWMESWAALEAVAAAPLEDAGPSARWLYDQGADREIEALGSRLNTAISERLAALESGLGRLPAPGGYVWTALAACR